MTSNLSSILGIKKKSPPSSAPPDEPEMASAAPPADLGSETPDEEASESDLTPDMLSYHDGSQSCGACSMFTAPATCSRFPDPVEEAGWCRGFMPMADTSEMGQSAAPDLGLPPKV